jgi:hypothetical protein
MNLSPKPPFEEFVQSCTPLLKIPELEQQMRERVRSIVSELLNFQPGTDPADNLKEFIKRDENFLGVLLALTNLSQEKFLRVITAKRFAENDFGTEWGAKKIFQKIKTDDQFAREIARLFLEGRNNQLLAEQVADFYLEQLSLPANWPDVIRDENLVGNIVRKKLTGEYTDKKGEFLEKIIREKLDSIKDKYGVSHIRGTVQLIGKEVDHVIPSLENPYVMIMVSYMETTSSGQTARANEQQAIYEKIVGHNVRYPQEKFVFVNIIDGAGWLARRSDLRKMHAGCDYCLNMNTLDQLEHMVCKFVPKNFFANLPDEVR